jgi:hypothetical protein
MKRFFQLLCIIACALPTMASAQVKVSLTDGIDNNVVKQKMENAISKILTEANEAQRAGRQMHYSQLGIPADVQGSLAALWENSPFVCMDEEIVEHCISTVNGYQVRNIPLLLKPVNPSDIADDEDYQEAVVSFDKQGNITSFYLSISMNLYMNVVKANRDITDLRRRQLILDYVEQFRTSYNQKDINFLEAVFSDDALIITGKVTKRKSNDGIPLPDKIEYTKYTKVQYLNNLRKVFARNRYIRVTFDEIEVMRHPVNKDFYGVTLHQGWTSETYHDDGYLFLLWDFRDEQHPQIHVRTWQPDAYNKDGKTPQRISKDEIFSLSDFDI